MITFGSSSFRRRFGITFIRMFVFLDLCDFFLSLASTGLTATGASTATGAFTGPVGRVAGAKKGLSEMRF